MYLVIFITQNCNFKCRHCLNECPLNEEIPLSKFNEIVNSLIKLGLNSITFTGGEPILHKNFKEMIKFTFEKKLDFVVISNGYLYKEYSFLLDYLPNFKTIYFSLDGMEKNHDENRKKGSFLKVMEAIDFFISKGANVKINLLVTKKNQEEVEDLLSILSKKGVSEVHLCSVIENNGNKDLVLDIDKRREMFWTCNSLSRKYGIKILVTNSMYNYGGSFFCTVLDTNGLHVNQRGELIYCCDIKDPFGVIGKITKNNIITLIEKRRAITNKIRDDRLIKFIKLNLSEIQEHTCEYCNEYFKNKS